MATRGMRRGYRPEVDVYRTGNPPALTVVVELPGVDPAGRVRVFANADMAGAVDITRLPASDVQAEIRKWVDIARDKNIRIEP